MAAERFVTERLAAWAATCGVASVPSEVLDKTRLLILDGLGCGVFGAGQPWTQIVTDLVVSSGGRAEARVWGTPFTVPALSAPLANGTAMHAFEYDDLHPQAVLHAGAQVLPAVFAAAAVRSTTATTPLTEQDLLHAVAVGFEVGARIGRATGAGQLARGFHPSPNTGTFAAAAAASRVLGLGPEATAHAFGIAGSFGGYLMAAQYGAMVKRVHPGHSGQSGLMAALLAERGLSGTAQVLEAPYGGFGASYADADPLDLEAIATDLGETWEIPGFSIKFYPCCGSNHTSIDAWWDILQQRPGLQPDEVEAIEVCCSTLTADHVGWPYTPDTTTTAQMNLRYCLAAAAVDGRFTVDQLNESRLADPAVLAMVERIRVVPDPTIDALGRDRRHHVRMTVTTKDGRVVETVSEHPRGSAANPLDRSEIVDKFRTLTSGVLSPTAVADLEQQVLDLGAPTPWHVEAFTRLLAPDSVNPPDREAPKKGVTA